MVWGIVLTPALYARWVLLLSVFMGLFLGCSLFCSPSEPVCVMICWIIRGSHSFLGSSSKTKTKFGELYGSILSFLHILILVKAKLPEDFPCRLFLLPTCSQLSLHVRTRTEEMQSLAEPVPRDTDNWVTHPGNKDEDHHPF